jgi:hypothetical protein
LSKAKPISYFNAWEGEGFRFAQLKPQIVMLASRGHAWDHLDPALPKLPHMRPSRPPRCARIDPR